MMAELIDRKQLKSDMKNLLRDAQVSPKGMAALYLALLLALDLVTSFLSSTGIVSTFFSILASLMGMVLAPASYYTAWPSAGASGPNT